MRLHGTKLLWHFPITLFVITCSGASSHAQQRVACVPPQLIIGTAGRLDAPPSLSNLPPRPLRDEAAGGSFKTCPELTRAPVDVLLAPITQSVPAPIAAQQKKPPFSLSQIKKMIPNAPDEAIAKEIRERGVNFKLTLEITDELRILGAQPLTIEILKSFIVNRPPSVEISPSATTVEYGTTVMLSGKAYDLDDDELEYSWSSSHGSLIGEGANARLETSSIALDTEAIEVQVVLTVTDRKGGSASAAQVLNVHQREAIKIWRDGDYLLLQFNSTPKGFSSLTGSIEIEVESSDGVFDEVDISGDLPGVPCNVEFRAYVNISEYSLKELPRSGNDYRSVVVRIRPQDNKRAIRFALIWRIIKIGNTPLKPD